MGDQESVAGPQQTSKHKPQEDTMLTRLLQLTRDDEGATALEYGLIAALIAGVIVISVTALGGKVSTTFDTITKAMP